MSFIVFCSKLRKVSFLHEVDVIVACLRACNESYVLQVFCGQYVALMRV